MIYLTGDTHGQIDMFRLGSCNFGRRNPTRDDYIVVLGDFGLLWHNDKTYRYLLNWLKQKPFTVLWLDGNHENHDWIDRLPVNKWHGGDVHIIADNVIHLMRGNVFTIEGNTFFVMGGAPSIDKERRIEGASWWAREEISREEAETALDNLEAVNGAVDYVLTHTCPRSLITPMFGCKNLLNSYTEAFLDEVAARVSCRKWYFGHWHVNKEYKRYHCLYEDIIPLEKRGTQ